MVDLLDGCSIILEWLDSVNPVTSSVFPGEFLDLLVCLPGDELQLFGPDVPCPGQVEHFLPCRVDDHRGHLVSREALVLEAILLSDHFVQNLVALGRDLLGAGGMLRGV